MLVVLFVQDNYCFHSLCIFAFMPVYNFIWALYNFIWTIYNFIWAIYDFIWAMYNFIWTI